MPRLMQHEALGFEKGQVFAVALPEAVKQEGMCVCVGGDLAVGF